MGSDTLALGNARKAELQALFDAHGTITAAQVLDYAAAPDTALHSAFTWDNDEAGSRYRLIEAQRLIRRTFVVMEMPGSREERRVHMAVSLPEDRGAKGYRLMSEVLDDPAQRDQLVRAAMRELASFRKKYGMLSELAELFAAADQVQQVA